MVVCSCVLDGERVNNHFILLWDNGQKNEQLKKFILQPLQFSKKSKIKKYFLFLLYAESENKTKFLLLLQVFFLCFYRLVTGKGSIYGGMFTFTEKPPEPEMLVCVHFHSQPFQKYSFSHNPYNPSIIGSYRKSTLNGINPQLLGVWNENRTSPKTTF